MSRRRAAQKRAILPDAKYQDVVLAKFVNSLMYQGKKSIAERIIYASLDKVQEKLGRHALEIFHEAMERVRPALEVRSRRVGGATYQVPTEVRSSRAQALAIRWLIGYARKRSEKTMVDRLSGEFLDACNHRGGAVKKREDTYKMAEANRAFAHYRW
jgi:small subunit ribosomal protein S7